MVYSCGMEGEESRSINLLNTNDDDFCQNSMMISRKRILNKFVLDLVLALNFSFFSFSLCLWLNLFVGNICVPQQ